MERSTPENVSSVHRRLSVSFLVSLMVLCARHASRISKKLKLKSTRKRTHLESNKAMTMVGRKNKANEYGGGSTSAMEIVEEEEEEEYGIWQREILMGGKCEPLDHSGVIYYDCSGHQLKEVPPRSPRVSLVPDRPTRS